MEMARFDRIPEVPLDPRRDEVINCLEAGLQFLRGETAEPAQSLARRVLANIIFEHLELCGYVVHRLADAGQAVS